MPTSTWLQKRLTCRRSRGNFLIEMHREYLGAFFLLKAQHLWKSFLKLFIALGLFWGRGGYMRRLLWNSSVCNFVFFDFVLKIHLYWFFLFSRVVISDWAYFSTMISFHKQLPAVFCCLQMGKIQLEGDCWIIFHMCIESLFYSFITI